MLYKKYIGLIMTSIIASSFIGCGGSNKQSSVNKDGDKAPYTEQIKLSDQYDSADSAMESEVKNIKYDLKTIVDSSRSSDTIADYPLSVYIEPVEDIIDDKESEHIEDKEAEHEEHEEEKQNQESLMQFLECTGTSEEDYSDYAIAFNKDKGYLVSVVKPTTNNKEKVESAIKNFISSEASNNADENIRSNYTNHKFIEHNGHFIVVATSEAETIKSSILSQMIYIDTIIGESVRNGYNQEVGQEVKELTEEEVEALTSENPSYSEVTQPEITGHVHEDGSYHDGETDSEEQSTPITGHYHADGTYHEGTD